MDKQKSFYLSGTFSLILYLSIVSLLIYEIKIPKFTQKPKVESVEINLEFFEPLQKEVEREMEEASQEKIEEVPSDIIEHKKPKTLSSLFQDFNDSSDVKTLLSNKKNFQDYRTKPTKVEYKKVQLKESNRLDIKDIVKKSDRSISRKEISKIKIKKADTQFIQKSDFAEFDSYYAAIQERLTKGWVPKVDDRGKHAKITFSINIDGKFDYFIKETNGNSYFIERLRSHIEMLKQSGFSKPEKRLKIEVNFYAKGEL
jgi:hypothetical protein